VGKSKTITVNKIEKLKDADGARAEKLRETLKSFKQKIKTNKRSKNNHEKSIESHAITIEPQP